MDLCGVFAYLIVDYSDTVGLSWSRVSCQNVALDKEIGLYPLWKKALQAGRLGGKATGDPSVQSLLLDQQIKAEIIQEQTQQIHLLKKALAVSQSKSASSLSVPSGKPSRSKKPAS